MLNIFKLMKIVRQKMKIFNTEYLSSYKHFFTIN